MNRKEFLFNTGVKVYQMEYDDKGKPKYYAATDKIINGERHIPFECEDVPDGATFKFACNNPNLPEANYMIVRKIISGGLLSEYAYFTNPLLINLS